MTRMSSDDYARIRALLSEQESDDEVRGYVDEPQTDRQWLWFIKALWLLILAAAVLVLVACDDVTRAPLSPSRVTVSPPIAPARTFDICAAIRSGRIQPLVRVPECD